VAPHTSAWVRATAPSGSAEHLGEVGWSGELGFGVRAPEAGQAAEDVAVGADEPADHGHETHDDAHAGHQVDDDDEHGGHH
jgi:NADH-quinone oxidoreductase subunit I